MSPLEARYRRLLACYPRDHRARHEAEMMGVLQAGARPGQTRPDLADVADLLRGAARVHARRAFGAVSAGAWRDGLAVAVALWPFLILVAEVATVSLRVAESLRYGAVFLERPSSIRFLTEPALVAALPALAVLLGRRWIAVLGVVAYVLYQADHPHLLDLDTLLLPNHGLVLLAQLATVAIAFAPAAYRAMTVIPRRAFLLWGPLALVGLIASKAIVRARWVEAIADHVSTGWKPVPWLIVVALAAGCACRSAVGRRAVLLLFLPAAALGDLGDLPSMPASTALAQYGCAALAFTAAAALTRRRSGLRRAPAS
ncbi:hypothetical protein [Streptosporangium sp. NBC_01756]|uniref:hypothetical protein n=1 Tax=Streptosporangium sp. NBC_01756 TaxID=2975950 RepID=UPI002DD79F88|nr:hypothetical protein [Streptosporangium sp. NBC_01756]WSC83884.1 hypothetical protein OIE48_26210 [Streptosporangium sp. NBC_01756]